MTKKAAKADAPEAVEETVERGEGAIRVAGPQHHTVWISHDEHRQLVAEGTLTLSVTEPVMREDTVELVNVDKGTSDVVPLASVLVVGTKAGSKATRILVAPMS